jgi:hypothetical protein
MKLSHRVLLIACLALPFAACTKEEAPVETVKAPLTAPTTDDRQAWMAYLSDVVNRNMDGIQNQPFVYMVPSEALPDFADQYDRLLEKAKMDVARGIIAGNLLAYGGHSSAKVADLVTESFKDVEPNSMKGVKVLFIGQAADNARVQAAVTPAGVDYKFVEAK